MTYFLDKPEADKLVKLSGKIGGYRSTRGSASFVYSESDQKRLGTVAVGAALVGIGGQAASVAAHASALDEAAEYLEFELNGDRVVGWVWRSPFREGDVVNVAAEWVGDRYEAYGIARPVDKMIALYPHCSRARGRHIKNTIKWWLIWNFVFFGVSAAGLSYVGGSALLFSHEILMQVAGLAVFFVVMFISLSRQYMPFVRLSEKVFRTLEIPNPSNVDLVKSSKQQRTMDDSPEFGTFYFRY